MIDNDKHIDPADLIGKYLSGEADPEEIRRLENWVLKDDENKKLFNEYRQALALTNSSIKESGIDMDAEWTELKSKVFTSDRGSSKVISIDKSKKIYPVLKIAAAVVVLVSLSFVLYYLFSGPSMEQIVAQDAIEVKTLPDGSNVTLNRHTTISYLINESKDKRLVELDGEAFFKVQPDAAKPFLIKAGNVEVEVVGTSFSVNSREENSTVEVVVESGKVAFKGANNQIVLTKGEKGVFEKSNGDVRKEINTDINYNSWKTNRLVFENTRLAHAFERISRNYHVSISVVNPEINSCKITATFDQKSLEAILTILEETLDLKIKKQGKEITVSGKGCLD